MIRRDIRLRPNACPLAGSCQIAVVLPKLHLSLVYDKLCVRKDRFSGVAPWPEAKAVAKNFYLILPERIELSAGPLQAFATWILDEARGM